MEAIKNGSYRDRFSRLMEAGIPVTDGSRYISHTFLVVMACWFKDVFGFPEGETYEETRSRFRAELGEDGSVTLVTSPPPPQRRYGPLGANAGACPAPRRFHVGKFETPTVSELRYALLVQERETGSESVSEKGLTFHHIVGDAAKLHRKPENDGSVMQVSTLVCVEGRGQRVRYWVL